jgi:hypothetical protein
MPYLLISESADDVKEFEKCVRGIAYVVAKYSIGYDFAGIDYICICDAKLSEADIIQCIGRGLRVDGDKWLKLVIPTFVDEAGDGGDYCQIIDVLRYLIHGLEMRYADIEFCDYGWIFSGGVVNGVAKDYGGAIIKAMLLETLIIGAPKWKRADFVGHMQKNGIGNVLDYYRYRDERPELDLPEYPHNVYERFGWFDVVGEPVCAVYEREECCEAIRKIIKSNGKEFKALRLDSERFAYLHKIDRMIPNECLWILYGGKRADFMF